VGADRHRRLPHGTAPPSRTDRSTPSASAPPRRRPWRPTAIAGFPNGPQHALGRRPAAARRGRPPPSASPTGRSRPSAAGPHLPPPVETHRHRRLPQRTAAALGRRPAPAAARRGDRHRHRPWRQTAIAGLPQRTEARPRPPTHPAAHGDPPPSAGFPNGPRHVVGLRRRRGFLPPRGARLPLSSADDQPHSRRSTLHRRAAAQPPLRPAPGAQPARPRPTSPRRCSQRSSTSAWRPRRGQSAPVRPANATARAVGGRDGCRLCGGGSVWWGEGLRHRSAAVLLRRGGRGGVVGRGS
jgi:hypothetical protein